MATVTDAPGPILVGRSYEQGVLARTLASGRPELVAVYGRRRVGKTYLIRTFFASHLCFEMTGVRGASQAQQLHTFAEALQRATGYQHQVPSDWSSAFRELRHYLETRRRKRGERQVIFFDELPWLASRRSGFLPAFEHFWNAWGSQQSHLIVIICGSAASWMIAQVLHQKGGLHNRVTRSIPLAPFRLSETEAFLRLRGLQLSRQQITEITMAVGGIPYYLDHLEPGYSAAQNIDALYFHRNAPLRDEFDRLFAALFEHYERHVKIIRVLAEKQSGLTRQELRQRAGVATGGNLTTILNELEASGFICRTVPFGRATRDTLYRLIDEFTLFYLRWVDGTRRRLDGDDVWLRIHGTPAWRAWSGYAFENLCLQHVAQIKQALGIAGVQTDVSSWRYQPPVEDKKKRGAQIDLLIDRHDGVINLCEMKYSDVAFSITKAYAEELRHKRDVFREVTGTAKSLFLTMVTTRGLSENEHQKALIQRTVTMDALFEP